MNHYCQPAGGGEVLSGWCFNHSTPRCLGVECSLGLAGDFLVFSLGVFCVLRSSLMSEKSNQESIMASFDARCF